MMIGEKLAAQRIKLDWTQQELADKLFVTRQTISKWELDKSQPDLDDLALLCQLLHLDVGKLLKTAQLNDGSTDELLAAPAITAIKPVATLRPFYVRAKLNGREYPQPVQWGKQWLKQIDQTRFVVGEAEFGQQLILKDETGQQLAAIDPRQAHLTVALLRSMRMNTRYQVLLSVHVGSDTYRLLIYSLLVVPELGDWLLAHAPHFSDPMQLATHRDTIDWRQLSKNDFEKLAANTPYLLPYQNNGSPSWT